MDAKPKMTREQAAAFLGEELCSEIDRLVAVFPAGETRAASMGALHALQHARGGHLEVQDLDAVAAYLALPEIQVYETASFYSMFETEPVGRHSVAVCTNISCMLCGGEEILAYIEGKLGIKAGESTPDGRIYLVHEEECLAACKDAPMMQVDHVYYPNLTPEKVDEILDGLE